MRPSADSLTRQRKRFGGGRKVIMADPWDARPSWPLGGWVSTKPGCSSLTFIIFIVCKMMRISHADPPKAWWEIQCWYVYTLVAVLGSCWIFLKTFYIHARKCVIQRQDNHQDGKHRDLFDTCFSGFCRATLHQLKRCMSRVDSKLMNV